MQIPGRLRERWVLWTTSVLFLSSLLAFTLADIGMFLLLIALVVVGYWGIAWFRGSWLPEIKAHYAAHGALVATADGVFVLGLYLATAGFNTWWVLIPALAVSLGLRRLRTRRNRVPPLPPLE